MMKRGDLARTTSGSLLFCRANGGLAHVVGQAMIGELVMLLTTPAATTLDTVEVLHPRFGVCHYTKYHLEAVDETR